VISEVLLAIVLRLITITPSWLEILFKKFHHQHLKLLTLPVSSNPTAFNKKEKIDKHFMYVLGYPQARIPEL